MLEKAKRLLRTPTAELVGRVTQRVYATSERLFPPATNGFVSGSQSASVTLAALASGGSSWTFGAGAALTETIACLRANVPADEARVQNAARRIISGELPVLGHGWMEVGAPPRWNHEPLAALSTPLAHWSRINYLDRSVAGDHKVLWEFNRHQHLITLAQAWQYSREPELLATIQLHLESWLRDNPPSRGANWASSLEVAYRSISWCWTFRLLSGVPSTAELLSPPFADELLASIHAHGRHVSRYLSTWFSPNTHLTGEALGLLYLGTCFPALADAEKWRRLGIEILESEVQKQVHTDGVYFEQATQYHRYTTEIYLHYVLIARSRGESVSEGVMTALHRLFDVLLALSRADGSMALLGDDDGGRLLQLDDRPPHDLRSLLACGAVVLEREDLAWAGRGDDAATVWLLGPTAIDRRDALLGAQPSATATAFAAGGLFAVRDSWHSPSGHATISCGPHGALSSGHSHADALAVELFVASGPLLVDKGTLAYDGAERNEFRSTAAHNTLELGGVGASEPGTPFRWTSYTDAKLDAWTSADQLAWLVGHHDGYSRLRPGLTHERSVLHPTSGVWLIEDSAIGATDLEFALRWHLAPGVTANAAEDWSTGAVLDLARNGVSTATLLLAGSTKGRLGVDSDRVSPQYGLALESKTVRWSGSAPRDLRVRSVVIDWGSLQADEVSVRGIPTVGDYLLRRPGILSAPSAPVPILHFDPSSAVIQHELTVTAKSCWYEPERRGQAARCVAIGTELVTLGAKGVVASGSIGSWLVAECLNGQWARFAVGDASVGSR